MQHKPTAQDTTFQLGQEGIACAWAQRPTSPAFILSICRLQVGVSNPRSALSRAAPPEPSSCCPGHRALLVRSSIGALNSTSSGMVGSHLSRGFWEAVIKSMGVIGASEIGDKTFFIAAIMAMRHHKWTVFSGALAALAAMTVLSAVLGWAAPALIPKVYTHYAATALFFFFGFKTLYDAWTHTDDHDGESELEQVEQELQASDAMRNSKKELNEDEGRKGWVGPLQQLLYALVSPVFLKAFTLTFLAEWGDRSQIATIGLAASADVVGVTIGSIVGHAACTAAAVVGGRHLAAHIDEHTVQVVGGFLFLLFGVHALWQGPQ